MPPVWPVTGSSASSVWITWTSDNTTSNVTDWNVNDVFQVWSQGTASVNVWSDWHEQGTGPYLIPSFQRPDPEAERERAARVAAEMEERKVADENALALLREHLTRRQRADLDKHGYFHVQTRDGERVYRIRRDGLPTRVKGEDGNRYTYCIHPAGSWPAGDKALAIKLLLETDEERFLEIANASRY